VAQHSSALVAENRSNQKFAPPPAGQCVVTLPLPCPRSVANHMLRPGDHPADAHAPDHAPARQCEVGSILRGNVGPLTRRLWW
jgi:hypothetical protein